MHSFPQIASPGACTCRRSSSSGGDGNPPNRPWRTVVPTIVDLPARAEAEVIDHPRQDERAGRRRFRRVPSVVRALAVAVLLLVVGNFAILALSAWAQRTAPPAPAVTGV